MDALPPGTKLHQDQYTLLATLGRGGFGITYRARDATTGQEVAIKECFPAGCCRQDGVVAAGNFASHSQLEAHKRNLQLQAQVLQTIRHPGIVQVHLWFAANNSTYLVMDLVPGSNLGQLLEAGPPPKLEEALTWTRLLAQAVATVHQAGLLHLDIKPENALFRGRGRDAELVLVDFDLMRSHRPEDSVTQPLALAPGSGTPGYAPLEQYAQHAPLTAATDIYALAATLYHLTTGVVPYSAIDRATGMRLNPARTLNPHLPEYLELAMEKGLALHAEQRFGSVAEFLEALQAPPPVVPTQHPEPSPQNLVSPSQPQRAPGAPAPQGGPTSGIKAAPPGTIGAGLAGPGVAPPPYRPPSGFYRVVLKTDSPQFPALCCCCSQPAGTAYTYKSPGYTFQLPLCDFCDHHRDSAHRASVVTFWGIALSAVIALAGLGISVLTSSIWPVLLGPIGVILNFSAMSYGALKNSRTEELLHDNCTDMTESVTHNFNGKVHIWRFKNAITAEEFRDINSAHVV